VAPKRGTSSGPRWGRLAAIALSAGLALIMLCANAALAQDSAALRAAAGCRANGVSAKPGDDKILLQADSLSYSMSSNVATATGHVEVAYYDCVLLADTLSYDSGKDLVTASGHVAIMEPSGDVVFADSLRLTDGLQDGVIEHFYVLFNGGKARLAAASARREPNGITRLSHVVYSPCEICNTKGFEPLWQVKARRVTHDQVRKTISYRDAVMEVKGVPVLYLPYFQNADPTVKRHSGFLVPTFGRSSQIGYYARVPYFFDIAPNQDLTLTPMLTTEGSVLMEGEYRLRTRRGQLDLDGSFTYADLGTGVPGQPSHDTFRSDLFGNGRFRINDVWSAGFQAQLVSDDTYLKLYKLSPTDTYQLDELTNRVYLDAFSGRSYGSLNAYYFQGLRQIDDPSTTPLVLPFGTFTWYPDGRWLGGNLHFDGSILSLTRSRGPDDQRVTLSGHWDRRFVAGNGEVFTPFFEARGDVYYTHDQNPTHDPALPRDSQIISRGLTTAGVDWRWPFIRPGRVNQVIEPIVQLIWSPYGGNPSGIPNEDGTSFEFDDTNLFSIDKLPGYDLVDSGPRANVGVRYSVYSGSGQMAEFVFGENFRLKPNKALGGVTGLGNGQSDYVGRLRLSLGTHLSLLTRFQIDHKTLSFKRNEVLAEVGNPDYWLHFSYLQLASDISPPSLGARKEVWAETHLKIHGNWALEAEARRDMANQKMIEMSTTLVFANRCLDFELQFKRDYTRYREIKPSSSVSVRIRLMTFGDTSTH
jgi:LPS-assembly protein